MPQEAVMNIGISSPRKFAEKTIAIAKGESKWGQNEPRAWFDSLGSVAQVLSEDNQKLLRIIYETNPSSIKELETSTGRKSSSLSRTLRSMADHGILVLEKNQKQLRPIVNATCFNITFCIFDL